MGSGQSHQEKPKSKAGKCDFCDDPATSELGYASYTRPSKQFCNKHRCKWRFIGSSFGCDRMKEDGKEGCYQHVCYVDTCKKVKISVCGKDCDRCVDHTCKFNNCSMAKLEDDDFCHQCQNATKCVIDGCYNKKEVKKGSSTGLTINDTTWCCNVHICKSPTVCRGVQSDGSSFCVNHKCINPECKNIASKIKGFCVDHKQKPYPPSVDPPPSLQTNKHSAHVVDQI